MARYKIVDRSPKFLPIVLDAQLMTGSFEYALDYLIDTEIDLSGIAKRYRNDETGAPAYDPAVLLKIVLLAYSRGVVSSRAIERLCREKVLFMAISGDSAPQFTTRGALGFERSQDSPGQEVAERARGSIREQSFVVTNRCSCSKAAEQSASADGQPATRFGRA